MNRKKLLLSMIGLVFVLLPLISCTTASPTTTSEFPIGKFVLEDDPEGFRFNEDGTFDYFFGSLEEPALQGTYSVDGNRYTEETINFPACPYPGTYTWTYDGQNLTFELFGEDECGVRVFSYTNKIYVRTD